MLHRHDILTPLLQTLQEHPAIQAAWQGGAAAFNRVDEWSDIDLGFIIDDNSYDDVVAFTDAALEKISPIDLRYPVPSSMWQGHKQVFYRLQNTSPYLLLDISFFAASAPDKLLSKKIHGESIVHFDKTGVMHFPPYHAEEEEAKVRARIPALTRRFELFQVLVTKEINRGNSLEALAFYHGFTFRPLVELLRIIYAPHHVDFYIRYLQYEFPAEVVQRVESLFYIQSLTDLDAKRKEAEQWFAELLQFLGAEAQE